MLCLLYLKIVQNFTNLKKVYVVEITRISAFHGYMTCSFFEFLCLTTLPRHYLVSRRRYSGFLKGFKHGFAGLSCKQNAIGHY